MGQEPLGPERGCRAQPARPRPHRGSVRGASAPCRRVLLLLKSAPEARARQALMRELYTRNWCPGRSVHAHTRHHTHMLAVTRWTGDAESLLCVALKPVGQTLEGALDSNRESVAAG